MPRKSDKRERLVDAAKKLIFQQGFNLTTLADIAQEADVPLGNVYYYFKTKEAIGEAVLAHSISELSQRLLECDTHDSVVGKLEHYLEQENSDLEWIVQHGDRYGSLSQELAKQGGSLAQACAHLLQQTLDWLQKQFVEAGLDDSTARDKSREFAARVQGMNLITATFKDAEYHRVLSKSLKHDLRKWVDAEHDMATSHHAVAMEAYA